MRTTSLKCAAIVVAAILSRAALAAVGTDCSSCHDEIAASFAATAHGRAFHFKGGGTWSCVSCHGAGEEHAEAGDPSKILSLAKAEASAVNESCLSCHREGAEQAQWKGGVHETAGVSCADCHSVHSRKAGTLEARPAGVTSPSTELCLKCHVSQRKSLNQRSTHPVREGKMQCASCHNPHGAVSEKLLRADSANDLCYSCHQEKRSPTLWDHSPVREDCLTCHTPHGSNQDRLLVSRVNQLCQSCHLQGRHQTVAGAATAMWNTNRACLNCHPQIHGSNHPSGVLFQR